MRLSFDALCRAKRALALTSSTLLRESCLCVDFVNVSREARVCVDFVNVSRGARLGVDFVNVVARSAPLR